jgi:thiamine-phosphate pyrophosphorylase
VQELRRRALLPKALIVQRYYITDRRSCSDVLNCIARAAASGVEFIQIREKDLPARDLLELTRRAIELARPWPARILVNGRVDVALAAGADGVHLPENAIPPAVWRAIVPAGFLIATSCHSAESEQWRGSDFAVFGPVFNTPGKGPAVGLQALRKAVYASPVPIFALGGIDETNAQSCLEAGARGIAGIRMFQSG